MSRVGPALRDAQNSLLLADLKDSHAALLDAIEELGRMTEGPLPTRRHLIDVRWKVSRASLSRRLLWGRIQMSLAARCEPQDRERLRLLQDADIALLRGSTEHVTKWTVSAIFADWEGYCRASHTMRARMRSAIGAEKRELYPILMRCDRPGH